jgi:hypothetical protein
METTLPQSWDPKYIADALKIGLLRSPSLVLSDSQAIDNRSLQTLAKEEAFRRIISQKTVIGPSLIVGTRGNSYDDVLRGWLDESKQRTMPTYLSALSESENQILRDEHKKGSLTVTRFKELFPDYFNHVEMLKNRIPSYSQFRYQLGLNSFKNSVLSTLDSVVESFRPHPLTELLVSLRNRWQGYDNPSRSDLREDTRSLASAGLMNDEQRLWIEDGILSFAYQQNFSRFTKGKLSAGTESLKWAKGGVQNKIDVFGKFSTKVPRNTFITGLKWEGLELIRSDTRLINSMERLRLAYNCADYTEAATFYLKTLREAYESAADQKLAPNPNPWKDRIVTVVKYSAVAAGAALGSLPGMVIGGLAGAAIGGLVSEVVQDVGEGAYGFLAEHGIFHPDENFAQKLCELVPPSQSVADEAVVNS